MPDPIQMNDDGRALDGAERELELALGRLSPTRPGISAAKVWADAIARAERARRAARMQTWIWRGIAAGLAASLVISAWPHKSSSHTQPKPGAMPVTTDRETGISPSQTITRANDRNAMADVQAIIRRDQVLSAGMTSVPDIWPADSSSSPAKDGPTLFELERSQDRGL